MGDRDFDYSFINDAEDVSKPKTQKSNDSKSVTITEEEFSKMCAETVSELVTELSKGVNPIAILTESLGFMAFSASLRKKLFEEGE